MVWEQLGALRGCPWRGDGVRETEGHQCLKGRGLGTQLRLLSKGVRPNEGPQGDNHTQLCVLCLGRWPYSSEHDCVVFPCTCTPLGLC